MIHPEVDPLGEQNFTKQMLNKKCNKLELFYSVGLAMVFANIMPFLTANNTDVRAVSDSSRDWQMIYFYTTSFILSVPLLLEFCFDSVIGSLYPAYDRNLVEHKIGHFMILFSLAAPLVLVIGAMTTEDESVFNPLFEKCFISGCQCLAFVAIYGTLQVTDKSNWKLSNSGSIVALFFGSQITMNFAIRPDTTSRDCHLDVPEAAISLSLLVLTLIAHLVASRDFLSGMVYALFDGTGWTGGSFKSDRFTTAILVSLITIFLIVRTVLTVIAVANSDDYNLPAATATTLLTNVIFALIAVALPGRMIRRGMVALKHEMESKKTFIRYISHEIRSPLSTTSLGLDYLIDQMSTSKRPLTAETILEVVKDARVSCELATNTLNDLLMFDKIETGMLELSAVECDAWEFVTSCVKPFQLQALCAGVAIHTTQIVPPVEPPSGLDATSPGNRSAIDLEAQLLTAVNNGHDLKKDNKKDVFDANSSNNRLCAVQVDRYKMEQVLRNFLTNALKFTPQHCNGSIAVNMSVLPGFTADTMSVNGEAATSPKQNSARQSSTRDKYSPSTRRTAGGGATATNNTAAVTAVEEGEEAVLRVEVVDTGPGISIENLPKLFGQYVQFDATTLQGGKGSGLGLWLSKAIVEMHGGVIGASSLGAGQGCTFYFELPCRVLLDAPTQHQLQTDLTLTNTSSAGVAFTPVSRKLGPIKHSGELTVCDEMPFVRPTITKSFSQKLPPNFMIPPPVLIPSLSPQQVSVQQGVESDTTLSSNNVHEATIHVTSNNTNNIANNNNSNIITTNNYINGNGNNNNNNNNNNNSNNNNNNSNNHDSEVTTFRISPAAIRSSVAPSPKTHVYSRAKHRGLLNASSGSISSAGTTERGSMRISGERTSMRSHRSHSPHSYSSLRSKGSLSTGQPSYNPTDASQVLVGLRVLLVDDSALARKMVERSLVSAECSVHHAQNGLEGVQKVQQSLQPGETPYDVVVIDCYMPVMNGPEAVTIMRGSECGFKGVIFAVTGASTNEEFSVGGAPGLGVDCVMVKPFNMETFRKTVFELKPANTISAYERLNQAVRTVHIG